MHQGFDEVFLDIINNKSVTNEVNTANLIWKFLKYVVYVFTYPSNHWFIFIPINRKPRKVHWWLIQKSRYKSPFASVPKNSDIQNNSLTCQKILNNYLWGCSPTLCFPSFKNNTWILKLGGSFDNTLCTNPKEITTI